MESDPLNCLLSGHVAPLLWEVTNHHFINSITSLFGNNYIEGESCKKPKL
jgi:hypothetical protein